MIGAKTAKPRKAKLDKIAPRCQDSKSDREYLGFLALSKASTNFGSRERAKATPSRLEIAARPHFLKALRPTGPNPRRTGCKRPLWPEQRNKAGKCAGCG